MFLIIKKHFLPLLFPAFTLFTIGYADDWAPESLEGIFTKITIDIPAHEMNVMGTNIPIPSSSQTNYSYIRNGTMYWGFNEKQMLSTMFFDYRKTSPKSFNLEVWFPYTKTFFVKGSISMTDEKSGSGPVVQVVNLQGHPLNGSEFFSGTLTCEVIDSVPLMPPKIASGIYSIETDDANHWVEADGMLTNGEEDPDPNHHFKYELPTDKNWSFEWVDNSDSSLYLQSPQANADLDFRLMQDKAGFEFEWEPVLSLSLDLIDPFIISTESYDPLVNSGIRVHYQANGRTLKAEFDENLSGNWVLFFEGSLDAGVDSWIYYNPTGVSQSSFVETQFEAIPGFFMDVESVLNQDVSATNSFQLYGPKAVSLTFAVGDHTLDDVTSGSMTDFATAGTVLGGGWRLLDWFKYYYATSTGWLFHLHHEWIYPVATSFDSVWLYSPSLGWLWTTQKAYPWTWFHTGKGWKYYHSSTDNWVSN